MNRRFLQFLQLTLASLDLLVLNSLFIIIRLIFADKIDSSAFALYLVFWSILNFCWIVISWIGKVYAPVNIFSFELFTKQTMRVYVIWILCIFFYTFISRSIDLSRLFVITTTVSFGLGLLLNRFAYIGIRGYFRNSDNFGKKVVILGYNEVAKKLAT